MNATTARRSLAALRTAIGLGALLAPHQTGRIFGMDMASNVGAPFFARLYGARQLCMAVPVLTDAADIDQRMLARLGVQVDVTDTVSAIAAGARGYIPLRAVAISGAVSALSAAVGVVAIQNR